MDRYLAAGDLKGNLYTVAKDGDRHLGAGRALHAPDHTVLRELYARYHLVVHTQEAVSGQHSYLFGRASRNDFKHDGRIIGHVELYSDAVEIAGKVCLGLLQLCRRHVDGMRVQAGKGS